MSDTAVRNGNHPGLKAPLTSATGAPGPDAMLKAQGVAPLDNYIDYWPPAQDDHWDSKSNGFATQLQKLAESRQQDISYSLWEAEQEKARRAQQQLHNAEIWMAATIQKADEKFTVDQGRLIAQVDGLNASIQYAEQEQVSATAMVAKALGEIGTCLTSDVSLKGVTEAVVRKEPTVEAVAGRFGVPCPSPHGDEGAGGVLRKAAIGLLLAVCMGTIIGLVTASDLRSLSPENLRTLLLPCIIGSGLVLVLAAIARRTGAMVARSLVVEPTQTVPPHITRRGWLALAIPIALFLGLAIVPAEVVTEAIGISETYSHNVASNNRYRIEEPKTSSRKASDTPTTDSDNAPLPKWVFVLLASVVSFPFVLESLLRGVEDGENDVLRPWLIARLAEEQVSFYSRASAATMAATACEQRAIHLRGMRAEHAQLHTRLTSLKPMVSVEALTALKNRKATAAGTARSADIALSNLYNRMDPPPPPALAPPAVVPESRSPAPKLSLLQIVGRCIQRVCKRFTKRE